MGSRSRAQSSSSVNKTSQWQLACVFRHAHPAPQRGYKRRARANAHQFFAEEPRLCAPAVQRWYSNYGDGTLRLRSLLQGNEGYTCNRDVPRRNETLRPETLGERHQRDRALNTCVICPTDGRDVTGGWRNRPGSIKAHAVEPASASGMKQLLAGMPEVWPRDAASRSFEELGLHT